MEKTMKKFAAVMLAILMSLSLFAVPAFAEAESAPIGTISYDFETDPALDGWTWEDRDGDGYNWEWTNGDPYWGYPEGQGCMASFSYDNDTYSPLYPDNWLISPEVPGGGSVSFMLCAEDDDYSDDHIGVYASANGGNTWSEELAYFTTPTTAVEYTVDLAAFAGQNIKIAFRHYNSYDQFCVNLDAVVVIPGVDPDVIFSVNTVYTKPDTDVQLDFSLEAVNPYECNAFTAFIGYNPQELELIGDELIKGEIWEQIEELGGMVAVDTSVPGKIGLTVIMPNEGFTAEGIIFSMNFKVICEADWQGVESPVKIKVNQFDNHPADGDKTPIPYACVNGSVNIYDMTFGDVNWDGRIDTTDVILIMRYTLGVQDLTGKYLAAADFNHDGEVDAVDALLLMRSIMNPPAE